MARARRLKVFQAQIGFYDTVVAVSSQPAALKAWGLRQDLFASGHAKVAEDPQAIEAALAHPDMPLKRPVGTRDPFELEAAGAPRLPERPPKGARRAAAGKAAEPDRARTKPPKPKADRGQLNAAETDLQALEETQSKEAAALQRRKDELEAEIQTSQAAHAEALKAAKTAVRAARSAYRKAGGRD
ncbi:hypothetical protein [Phenylobacterium sp.]|uniref:hypothetical protein n=1 Tax=Phenylobacterium sp. TaxID=1871053 RepID=UPI002731D2FE|nr:hypothetical protein [Phenylobacterium sp.]